MRFRVRNTSSLGEVAVIAQIRHWLGAVAPSHPGSRLHERSCIVYSSRPLNAVRRLKSRGVAHYTFCASIREYPLLATVRDFAPFPSIRATVRVSMTACCNNAAVFCIDKRRVGLQPGKVAKMYTRTVWVRPRAARRSTNVCWTLQIWRTYQWY